MKRSDILKILSTRLKNTGSRQGEKNINLKTQLEREKEIVKMVEDIIRQTGISDNKLSDELNNLENDSSKILEFQFFPEFPFPF